MYSFFGIVQVFDYTLYYKNMVSSDYLTAILVLGSSSKVQVMKFKLTNVNCGEIALKGHKILFDIANTEFELTEFELTEFELTRKLLSMSGAKQRETTVISRSS
jgi:hypothetical protein